MFSTCYTEIIDNVDIGQSLFPLVCKVRGGLAVDYCNYIATIALVQAYVAIFLEIIVIVGYFRLMNNTNSILSATSDRALREKFKLYTFHP